MGQPSQRHKSGGTTLTLDSRAAIEALKRHGIEVRSAGNPGESIVYTLEGRLPEFPFRSRHTSYDLVAAGEDDFVEDDQIDTLLLHFWQGQVVLGDNDGQ